MTRRRTFKRRIRDRMARTGESYSTARAVFTQRARSIIAGTPAVMIPITDMPRAIAFYRDALGFPLLACAEDDTWAELGDATNRIALHPNATTGADVGLGLLVSDTDQLERAITQHDGRIAERNGPVITATDPDGNIFRLMTR